jgi:hypothetical protein
VFLENMLRESLVARSGLSGDALEENVRQAAREIVARSALVDRAAWTASQIASRDFRTGELTAMNAQDKQLWLALLKRPLMTCEVELNGIHTNLVQESDLPSAFQQYADPFETVPELATAAESLRRDADRLDRLLVAGFALSPEASSPPVSEAELLNQLMEVEREERRLGITVQHLQQAAAIRRTK